MRASRGTVRPRQARTRRRLPQLARFNIPASVIGGLLVAFALLACRHWDAAPVQFDTTLERPLMIAFFTSIGFNASVSLLRISGRQVALFLGLATFLAVVQNVVGIGVAKAFGLSPLFGVVAGSATLTGGPATGLAFAPLFEQAGVVGAKSIALASAMAGIVIGSIVGAPLATMLIERHKLAHAGSVAAASRVASDAPVAAPASNTSSTNERLPHALMDLHLWDLAGVATPLLVNLGVQTIIVVAFCCWPLLQLMGRDYDAAVMTGGFAGFMLGITANAMAVMDSLTERFGPAPRAFLVAPLVGAFLIDFTNAIVITFFINAWK